MSDWNDLLDMEAGAAVRPPPIPKGNYRVVIDSTKLVKSSKKQTPGVEFFLKNFDPQADVDPDKWQAFVDHPSGIQKDLSRSETYWLTKPAMWRLRKFCETVLGKELPESTKMVKAVADCEGQTVVVEVDHQVSEADGETVFDNLRSFSHDA